MALVWLIDDVDAYIAHLPEIKAKLKEEAQAGFNRARAKKAADKTDPDNPGPHSRITLTHGSLDWFVNLEDPGGAAAAIEFGSRGREGKHYISGVW